MAGIYPKRVGLFVGPEMRDQLDQWLPTEFSTTHFTYVEGLPELLDQRNRFDTIFFEVTNGDLLLLKSVTQFYKIVPQILVIDDDEIENFLTHTKLGSKLIMLRSEVNLASLKKMFLLATKHAEQNKQFYEYRRNFIELFELSPLSIFIIDPESRCIVNANYEALKTFAYSRKELENQHISVLFKEDYADVSVSRIMMPIGRRRLFPVGEIQMEDKDRKEKWFNVFVNTIITNNKEYRMLIAIDVTAGKDLEQAFAHKLIETQDRERIEIGRELHDNFSQLIVTASLSIEMFLKGSSNDLGLLEYSMQMIDKVLTEMRTMSHTLSPVFASFSSVEGNILKLVSDYTLSKRFQLDMFIDHRAGSVFLGQDASLHFVRILQVVFNNIVTHSEARSIALNLEYETEGFMLTIKDDGIGFPTEQKVKGIGHFNIRQRVEILGGRLTIFSSHGNGCFIQMFIPWKGNVAEEGIF